MCYALSLSFTPYPYLAEMKTPKPKLQNPKLKPSLASPGGKKKEKQKACLSRSIYFKPTSHISRVKSQILLSKRLVFVLQSGLSWLFIYRSTCVCVSPFASFVGGGGLPCWRLGERFSTGGNTGVFVTSPGPNDRGGLCLVGENPGDEGAF